MKLILINGSIIQVVGSDNAAQTLVGTNPQGIVFSEWAIANPDAYTFLRPALVYNNAWVIFVSCVAPNTLVIGENGLRRIGKLSDSRKEYTPYDKKIYGLGGFHNAQDFYYGGKQKTLKIELTSGYELECTPVHPIWTGTEWKKSSELKIGDLLPIQYGQNIWGKGFDFNNYTKNEHGGCKWLLENRGPDYKFFYLLGLIHADGSYDKNKITVTKKKDQQIIDFLHEYGFSTFKDGIHHNLSSKIFVSFLEESGFKHGAREKILPESLLNCSKDQIRYFLQGLFDGDGTSNSCPHKRGTVKLTSTCLDFMKDIQIVLLNFGIVSHINSEHKAPTKKVKVWSTIYNLEIQGYFAKVFYEEIGFRLERKQKNKQFLSPDRSNESGNIYPIDISRLEGYKLTKNIVTNPERITRRLIKQLNENNPHPYLQELLSEKFFYSQIKSITESENEVFDFVIPETHSFFSNGFISHNTPRGRNFFYEMSEIARCNPKEWFMSTKTVHDTGVISLEEIAKEKAEGLISDDMIEQEYNCFPGDQLVMTHDRAKPISEIKADELIISHAGRMRKVLKTISRDYDGELIEIKTFGSVDIIKCTPEHPLRVYNLHGQTYSWKMAKDITEEDRLVFPKLILGGLPLISYELCMLMAWYICDGSSFKNGVSFSVSEKKSPRIKELLNKLGIDFHVFPTESIESIIIYNVQLVDFFKTYCGVKCHDKRIQFPLISGFQEDFFNELMKGDGCLHKGKYTFTTTSKHLAYQIQILGNSINKGYAAGISKRPAGILTSLHDGKYKSQMSYQIPMHILRMGIKNSPLIRAKYSIAARVISINRTHYVGKVYNLSVQYDESYLVYGRSVHNCSFSAGCEGSFYFRYINQMRLDNRITYVPFESAYQVNTAWDIGYNDLCIILFFQEIGTIIRVLRVYSNNLQGMEHYAKILREYEDKYGYQYGKHWAPHDIAVHEFGTGQSRIEKAKNLGIKFQVRRNKNGEMSSLLPNLSVEDGIEAVRSSFGKMWIDETNCAPLIKALESYRREWDSKRKLYKDNPLHDINSHFADAFRYLVLSLTKSRDGGSPEELDRRYQEAMYGQQNNVPRPFQDPINKF